MTDTAEYWKDIKHGHRPRFGGRDFIHIPGADCGHRHNYEAKIFDEVTCYACLNLVKNGFKHNLE